MIAAQWSGVWTAALVNHLWQSTIVFLLAWMLALMLRRQQARARYWVWMGASIKFLLPFSLLVAVGESLRLLVATPAETPAFAVVMAQIAQPFPQAPPRAITAAVVSAAPVAVSHHGDLLPLLLAAVWMCGVIVILLSWARGWWRIREAVRGATPMALLAAVPVLISPQRLEPGVFGVLRPVLLLPEGITERLTAAQLATILAHEVSHVRRHDNLTAAMHMLVEALFWFHPAVWLIRARLLEERERACDEAVLQSGNEARVYAESILSVCKLYAESPLVCMAGVTGSDLTRRIVRIMTGQVTRKLGAGRKLLLGMAAVVLAAVPMGSGFVHVTSVHAQATAGSSTQSIADTWQGTLHAGRDLRTVVKITKADGGGYNAAFYSIDQGGDPIPVTKITLEGTTVKMSLTAIGGAYEGKLSADGKTIAGSWTQGPNPLPLNLTRATPETEWTIPAPTPRLPPMDANASPTFEVATIKPSKPDEQGKAFRVIGRRFKTINMTMTETMSFAYGIHAKQIIGAPDWFGTEKFDIDAQPDGQGAPSDKQWKGMLQKLIVERCKLTYHPDKRELAVYVLSVAKTGPKLTKSDGDPNGLPGLFFRGRLGDLNVRNANMVDFTGLMQNAVLDRPVLDQTKITGRYDFTLNWTPDDSQFGGMGAKIPPSTDSANAPPALYTAIQEQIGLKLDATKAPADVFVLDHVERPSEN